MGDSAFCSTILYMAHINQRKEFLRIVQKYIRGKSTKEELNFIKKYYASFEGEEDVLSTLSEKEQESIKIKIESSILEKIAIEKRGTDTTKPVRHLWKPLSIAAAIVILIASSIVLNSNYNINPDYQSPVVSKNIGSTDIAPGGNKAILTLADGTTISLDDTNSGEIVKQGGMKITKTEKGLMYTVMAENHDKNNTTQFNTISTPKGGQYQIILPDGTSVWLNAASSLKYPVVFTGKERRVELIGEAYFEVNSQRFSNGNKIPFFVNTSGQTIEVLGTHFNVNAYLDEPSTKTTLLEGSVKIVPLKGNTKKDIILEPGEQATLNSNNNASISKVNTDNVIAWKNGLFQFQDSELEVVMRELSRWYNVKVEFEGEIPDIQLWGKIYRNVNASEVLEILSYFGFKYKIVQTGKDIKIVIS